MRRRLDELLSESFEYQTPSPALSPEVLELEADPGTTLSGYLTISHPAKKRLRGFVFSSNPRMHTEQTDFYNTSAKIRYSIDLTALPEGAVTEGVFTFCTDLGEARIPCRVQVRKKAQKRNAIRVRECPGGITAWLRAEGKDRTHAVRDAAHPHRPGRDRDGGGHRHMQHVGIP